jgi:hypothetical protein
MNRNYVLSTTLALVGALAQSAAAQAPADLIKFNLQRSVAASGAGCLAHASAVVTVKSLGEVEVMNVSATGLPANAGFDLFVIQVPNSPFGMAWYQGDMQSDAQGRAVGTFIGRFNEETFIVANGPAVAPIVHETDAAINPATPPVHMFHVGLWFNSPEDAVKAGCPATVTPFNGDHNAGIQALSTTQFPKDKGPLGTLKP